MTSSTYFVFLLVLLTGEWTDVEWPRQFQFNTQGAEMLLYLKLLCPFLIFIEVMQQHLEATPCYWSNYPCYNGQSYGCGSTVSMVNCVWTMQKHAHPTCSTLSRQNTKCSNFRYFVSKLTVREPTPTKHDKTFCECLVLQFTYLMFNFEEGEISHPLDWQYLPFLHIFCQYNKGMKSRIHSNCSCIFPLKKNKQPKTHLNFASVCCAEPTELCCKWIDTKDSPIRIRISSCFPPCNTFIDTADHWGTDQFIMTH